MSGSGGGKPGDIRAFWDPNTNQAINIQDGINAIDNSYFNMKAHIEILEKRIEALETAYMELKMLGDEL